MRIGRMAASIAAAALVAGGASLAAAPAAFAAPGNDNIADATVLAPGSTTIDGSNVGATIEPGEDTPAGGKSSSVWYTWTAAETGPATIDTCLAATFDTTVAVFNYGDFSAAALIVANDDACGLRSAVTFDAVAGTKYSIQVNSWSSSDGTFTLTYPSPGATKSDTKDLTIWLLSTGRPSQESTCDVGYAPSWAQWPNDGTGGWVCDRYTYAYYPNEEVK